MAFKVLFLGLLLLSASFKPSMAQTAYHVYFPGFVLPHEWFKKVGADDFHGYLLHAMKHARTPLKLRGSKIAFYPSVFLLDTNVQQVNISMGLINDAIGTPLINHYQFGFITTRRGGYYPHVLPVIYKKQHLPYLPGLLYGLKYSPLERYKVFMQNPGGGDTLQSIFRQPRYSREGLMRRVFYETPWLVELDYHELPEPPREARRRDGIARRGEVDNIVDLLRVENVAPPARLERVRAVKSPWTFSGSENIHFSQVFLHNWTRGGNSSVALLSDLRLNANYVYDDVQWENRVNHKLGIIASEGRRAQVNDDLIELMSKYGINANKNWFYSVLFNFRTQFFEGFARGDLNRENPISAFMAPAYFSLAAGMDYKRDNFTLMLSPVTSRLVVVLDTARIDQQRYNIAADRRSLFLTGASLQNNFRWNLSPDIKFTSSINAFYDYFQEEENIQAEWDMVLDMRINVFLSTRVIGNLRYFETESDQIQARQSLSIAFRYNF